MVEKTFSVQVEKAVLAALDSAAQIVANEFIEKAGVFTPASFDELVVASMKAASDVLSPAVSLWMNPEGIGEMSKLSKKVSLSAFLGVAKSYITSRGTPKLVYEFSQYVRAVTVEKKKDEFSVKVLIEAVKSVATPFVTKLGNPLASAVLQFGIKEYQVMEAYTKVEPSFRAKLLALLEELANDVYSGLTKLA